MGKRGIIVISIWMILILIACSGNDQWNEESDGETNSEKEVSENITAETLLEDTANDQPDIQMDGREIECDNPYFFSTDVTSLTADISFFDFEEFTTIRGDLELHWLKQYENGCIAKLSIVPSDHIPSYILNWSEWRDEYEYSNIYFYVTSDKIYRINTCIIEDGENVYAYENEKLFIDLLDSEEKIIENAELVCCPEGIESEYTGDNIGDSFYTGEIGTHYEIVVSENQIAYCRQEYPAGHMEFYNTFVWEKGRGLIEHKRGYRAGALLLYIENINVE